MEKGKIKINYLYNSSFKIETEKYVLIFDYYNDKSELGIKNSSNGVIGESDLDTDKHIIVFASHSHGDHFNDVIFSWKDQNPNIKYILSSDIKQVKCNEHISIMSAYEELILDDVYIKAFGSTDIGISFLVKLEGATIFHAGDLNWWHWYDEIHEDNIKMEKLFKEEIEKIKDEHIDLAFFPVDSRLKESYVLGPDYFIDKIKPKALIPMHFREDYAVTKEFADKSKGKEVELFNISKRGEELIY
jgi:L-ascorbate metabolism protein UlaG (beta-lactamase superfamily)